MGLSWGFVGTVVAGMFFIAIMYLAYEFIFKGQHKALVFEYNKPVRIEKASKVKTGEYKFKSAKKGAAPKDNVYSYSKYDMTLWYMKNGICVPLNLDITKGQFKIPDVNAMIIMAETLKRGVDKTKVGFWERNKEFIMSFTIIGVSLLIYLFTLYFANKIDPNTTNACLSIASDVKNSSITTHQDVQSLIDVIKGGVPR